MKKITFGICCLALLALIATTYSQSSAVLDQLPDQQTENSLSTQGTTLAHDLSIEAMTDQSDVIAIGDCLNTRSMWVDRTLVTLATISVDEVLKGGEDSTITVVLPGGVDANRAVPVAMSYAGAPTIQQNEKVFLFLTHDDMVGGGYTIAGFSQGKFSVVTNENGQEVVSRNLTKTALKGKYGTRLGTVNQTTLANLKAQVKRQLGNR